MINIHNIFIMAKNEKNVDSIFNDIDRRFSVAYGGTYMNNRFVVQERDVATLVLINTAVSDIVEDGCITAEILEELEFLQPHLEQILSEIEKPITNAVKAI